MTAAIQYIQRIFADINAFESVDTSGMPSYLADRFNFVSFSLLGNEYVLSEYKEKQPLFIENLKKDIAQIKKYTNRYPIFVFNGLRLSQREGLIKYKISFVVPEAQIFIPYPPIYLTETEVRERTDTVKFKKTTQVIFAFLLLNDIEIINAHRLAEKIGCSVTTANRSLNELVDKGLLEQIHSGTRKKYIIPNKKEYWEQGKQFLFNPITDKFLISETKIDFDNDLLFKSGETALCQYSDYFDENTNHERYFACFNNDLDKVCNDNHSLAINYSLSHFIGLHTLAYNPSILARNGAVDPVTLYAQYIDENDERIEIAFDKILSELLEG